MLICNLHAQPYNTLHYTAEDGLPSNKIYGVYRDSRGFLWMGSDKGVTRFNGLKFENFTTFDGLPDNEIFFATEDAYGRIWLGTYNGKLCYYQNGTFFTEKNAPWLHLSFRPSFINQIFREADSSITINFVDTRWAVNIKGDHLQAIDLEPCFHVGFERLSLLSARRISSGNYLVLTNRYQGELDPQGHLKILQQLPPRDYTIKGSTRKRFLTDSAGMYDEHLNPVYKFKHNFFEKNFINTIFFPDDHYYFLTPNGLFDDTALVLSGRNTSAADNDINGNIWISTLNDGVYCMPANFARSRVYPHVYSGDLKFAFVRDEHIFFVNSDENLYSIENGRTTLRYESHLNDKGQQHLFVESAFLIDSDYNYYYFHHDNNVIVSNIFGPHPRVVSDPNGSLTASIKSIYSIAGQVYTRQRARIFRFMRADFGKPGFQPYCITDTLHTPRIFASGLRSIDSTIWYSNAAGVFKIRGTTAFRQQQFGDITFKNFTFFGSSLVGTTFDNKLLICRNIDADLQIDTIPAQGCIWDKCILLDSSHLLISTNERYRVLVAADSKHIPDAIVVENPFVPVNAEAICADGGMCYFFKQGNIVAVPQSDLYAQFAAPKIYFRSVIVGDTSYPAATNVIVPYTSRDITVALNAVSFTGGGLEYEYAISQDEQVNWQPLKGNYINLIHPSFGHYTIRVRARTLSGRQAAPIFLRLTVLRPFWAQWWSIIIYFLLAAGAIALLIRWSLNRAIRKRDDAHTTQIKYLRSEYKALNALMNPHFIFNTLNNVQGLINSNDRLAANEYLRIFADMIRQNMHNISRELIPLSREIELVENYLALEKLRFKDLLNYRIEIDDAVDTGAVKVPPLLVQPLVENSIKHGILPRQRADSMILVRAYEADDMLHIEVLDNGAGFNYSPGNNVSGHESFGLQNIRNRVHQLGLLLSTTISFDITERQENGQRWTVAAISMRLPRA